MNLKTIKRTETRLETTYNSTLNIQQYGGDNLYPQEMLRLIAVSPTGGTCLDRYAAFIEGNGLNNLEFSEYVCNHEGQTMDDIYHLIAQDMAKMHGFALHVCYNSACQITEIHHIPFQDCRLEEENEDGTVTYINVHPDWSGTKTRKGKKLKVDKKTIRKFYTFNPRKAVVMSEADKDGGFENFRGQILWVSLDGMLTYPLPIYDKVTTELSTDEGLANVKYRNVRNNFLPAGMMLHRKGIEYDGEGNEIPSRDDFADSLRIFQGDTNACSILDVTFENEEDKPTFEPIQVQNFDKLYEATEASVTERIYAAFGQEPWYAIRIGKLGFSGEILQDAYEYYNSFVSKERKAISRALKQIFSSWFEVANPSGDYEIQPLVYINNETTAEDGADSNISE